MNGVEADSGQEQLVRILAMVADGTLSPGEADELIAALQEPLTPSVVGAPPPPEQASIRRSPPPSEPGTAAPSHASGSNRVPASAELRRLGREARRMAHEARRAARQDLRDAVREAKQGIEKAMRLSIEETSRAVREVEAELKGIFGEPAPRGRRNSSRWVSQLAGLEMTRDTVKLTSSLQLQQELSSRDRVTIRNASGDVLVRGWGEMRVEVRGDRTAWGIDKEMAQDRAESLPVEISRRNGEVIVEARSPVPAGIGVLNMQRMRTDLVVMVPAQLALEISTRNGDVTVVDHAGPLAVSTTRGDINIAEPKGNTKAETVSGDIQIGSGPVSELEIVSASGDISAGMAPLSGGQYRLRSASGDVTVRVGSPGWPRLRYEAETVSGELHVQLGGKLIVRELGRIVGEVVADAREDAGRKAGDPGDRSDAPAVLRVATISGDVFVS